MPSTATSSPTRLFTAIETRRRRQPSKRSGTTTSWCGSPLNPTTRPRTARLRVISWFMDTTTARRYEILDRQFFDGGFVQQHVLHATGRNGGSIAMRVCIVIKVGANGLISRIDEYFDPADIGPTARFERTDKEGDMASLSEFFSDPASTGTWTVDRRSIDHRGEGQVDVGSGARQGPLHRVQRRRPDHRTANGFRPHRHQGRVAAHRDPQARQAPALRGFLRGREVPGHQRASSPARTPSTATPSGCVQN